MKQITNQRGFTIIEVLLVIGISAMLIGIGLIGQGGIRQRAQFTDSLETLEAELESIKTKSVVTANTSENAGGNDSDEVIFGTLVGFEPDESEYRSLILKHDDDIEAVDTFDAVVETVEIEALRWNLHLTKFCETGSAPDYCNPASEITDRSVCILFYRDLQYGNPQIVTLSGNVCESNVGDRVKFTEPTGASSITYANGVIHTGTTWLHFSDNDKNAAMRVDASTASGAVEVIQL